MLDRGYYEGLAMGSRFNAELWEFYMSRPQGEVYSATPPGTRLRNDYLGREFIPNSMATIANQTFYINRWGMYDREYELEKQAGTYRIALVGASRAMGWGVTHDDRFETILEQLLNDKLSGGKYQRFEILNFSVFGYHAIERLLTLENAVLRFRPDAVLYVSGLLDLKLEHHAQAIRQGLPMPYDFAERINQEAGVERTMSEAEIVRRLQPYRYEIVSNTYRRFMERVRENHAVGVWIHVPSISDNRSDVEETRKLAAAAGFETIDLTTIYDPMAYRLSRWDGHPNVSGHRLIAGVLFESLNGLLDFGALTSSRQ
jgi:hypothetical protein